MDELITDDLVSGQTMHKSGETIQFETPYKNVISAEFTIKANTTAASDAYYYFYNTKNEKVGEVHAEPANYAVLSGTVKFDPPIEIASVKLYSWWNAATAITLRFTYKNVDSPTVIGTDQWYDNLWREREDSLHKAIQDTIAQIGNETNALKKDLPTVSDQVKELQKLLAEESGTKSFLLQKIRSTFKTMLRHESAPEQNLIKAFMMLGIISEMYADVYSDNETDNHLKRYEHESVSKCKELLRDLVAFSEIMFTFFHEGFYGTKLVLGEAPNTENPLRTNLDRVAEGLDFAAAKNSSNYVLETLLEQTSIDLNLIRQVSHQRSQPYLRKNLFVADAFAKLAIKPAIDHDLLDLDTRYTEVLCYLNRKVEIRLLPYQDAVLIGIPFAANAQFKEEFGEVKVTVSTDYLAIPHEVGHNLYQYSSVDREGEKSLLSKVLQDELAAQATSKWISRWLEEIFADIYGCLIAGPVSVLGFQEHLATSRVTNVQDGQGEHPIPVLRPLIQSQILRSITDQDGNHLWKDEPDQLDAHWQQRVKELWPDEYSTQTDTLLNASYEIDEPMTGQEILDELKVAIDVILSVLELHPENRQATWTPDWGNRTENEKITELFTHFFEFAAVELPTARIFQLLDIDNQPERAAGAPSGPYRWLMERLEQRSDEGITEGIDGLIELLLFDGWSTEGPRGGNMH